MVDSPPRLTSSDRCRHPLRDNCMCTRVSWHWADLAGITDSASRAPLRVTARSRDSPHSLLDTEPARHPFLAVCDRPPELPLPLKAARNGGKTRAMARTPSWIPRMPMKGSHPNESCLGDHMHILGIRGAYNQHPALYMPLQSVSREGRGRPAVDGATARERQASGSHRDSRPVRSVLATSVPSPKQKLVAPPHAAAVMTKAVADIAHRQ